MRPIFSGILLCTSPLCAEPADHIPCQAVIVQDADTLNCNGQLVRLGVENGNQLWLDAPDKHCGLVYWQGGAALARAIESATDIRVTRIHEPNGTPATAGKSRIVGKLEIDGKNWAETFAALPHGGRIVHRKAYIHGQCPKDAQ